MLLLRGIGGARNLFAVPDEAQAPMDAEDNGGRERRNGEG